MNKCVNCGHLRISEHLDVDIDTFGQCCDAQTVNNNVYSHLFSHRYEAHSGYHKLISRLIMDYCMSLGVASHYKLFTNSYEQLPHYTKLIGIPSASATSVP